LPRAGTHRPQLEALEDRVTPTLVGPQLWYAWSGIPSGQFGPFSGDFTSDGIVDQINTELYEWLPHYAAVVVRPGHGDGTFGNPIRTFIESPLGVPALAVADFNNDSRLDVFTWENDMDGYGGFSSDANYATVLLGHGNGSFDLWETFTFSDYGQYLCIGDIGWDGHPDVILTDGIEEYALAWINDGDWGSPEPPPPAPPHLSIDNATITEGNAGEVAATFTVTLPAASSEAITVDYATGDDTATAGSDYQTASGTLTFAPGEIEKTITVLVNSDRLGEPNETFVVNLSNPTNAAMVDSQGLGTIVDDEPRISITDVTKSEGRKGKTTLFTFTVTLSAAYDQAVTMSFQTVNGTAKTSDGDYIAKSGTLTFAPGQTTKTITIEVKGDSKRETNETFYLDLFGLSSNAVFTKNRGLGTILNDD
jgi:hypothetical protein